MSSFYNAENCVNSSCNFFVLPTNRFLKLRTIFQAICRGQKNNAFSHMYQFIDSLCEKCSLISLYLTFLCALHPFVNILLKVKHFFKLFLLKSEVVFDIEA